MVKYLVVSFAGGILFGVLDGLIHANPLAQRLYEVYKPIARTSVNAPAGILIDLVYGFVTAGLFLLLYKSLPGSSGWLKGLGFGVLVWIFRVVMSAASQWVMFNLPARTIAYSVLTGLGEMVILGLLFGLTLRPAP
jgi:uncharacterized membrane protein